MDVKIDVNLMRITTEIEVFGISVEDTERKIKLTPGVSYTMGKLQPLKLTTIWYRRLGRDQSILLVK